MKAFLSEIVEDILHEETQLSKTVWIFPSKRAGVFAKDYLKKQISKTAFAPEFYSIESFVTKIADIQAAPSETALCFLYECYLESDIPDKDSFSAFLPWGTTLLQDYNEIDRYGVNAKKLYGHIQNLQEVSHWALAADQTEMVKNYLKFWEQLPGLYERFTNKMLQKGQGHQGLIYKTATQNLESYLEIHTEKRFFFIGFNALNTSESSIIQTILKKNRGQAFWDVDQYFLDHHFHEAGYFIRKHKKEWPYFEKNPVLGVSNYFTEKKEIQIFGAPKSVSQAHLIGHLLEGFSESALKNTAVVLGDENLLNPVLHTLPPRIKANITMGYPLSSAALTSLVNALFELQTSGEINGWYISQVKAILQHRCLIELLDQKQRGGSALLLKKCHELNSTFTSLSFMKAQLPKAANTLQLVFKDHKDSPKDFLQSLLSLLEELEKIGALKKDKNLLSETLYFKEITTALQLQLKNFSFIDNLKGLRKLYQERLGKERLSFSGEALSGLQIMGMLESRNLDFETVIISHVNEGILPGGKSNNSFIPLSLKKEFGLPTFKEKDAVYAYHFYRLLQRAKKVYLLYNTATDVLEGGEPSRFIHQLSTQNIPGVVVKETFAMPLLDHIQPKMVTIKKDPSIIKILEKKAAIGFSPSAINTYIRNPIDFYKRYVLGIKDPDILEEIIAYNTFGTIVHDSLEALYKDYVGVPLQAVHFKAIKAQLTPTLKSNFERLHSPLEGARGKNIIAHRVILKYLEDYVAYDQQCAEKESIVIEGLEIKYSMPLYVSGIDVPVLFSGTIDRIDKRSNQIHIIDFKTGLVQPGELKLKNWEDLTTEPKNSKTLQLLAYASLYQENHPGRTVKAGIYSFKNTKLGTMYFENSQETEAKQDISTTTTKNFKESLTAIIQEIFDLNTPFVEKEI
jgi:hypothetical protein